MPKHTRNLIKIIEQHNINPILGAEIGVRLGKNAIGLLKHFPDLQLDLIDNYIGADRIKKIALTRLYNSFKKDIGCRYWLCIDSSIKAAEKIKDRRLDFVFIDANHSYKSVKQDIEAWLPKVRIGGLLTGHDFTPQFEGLQRAVEERFGDKFSVLGDIWYTQVTEDLV
jgi:predicted O-methyltransferase YrrM